MTRQDYVKEVNRPGKFEGEACGVPYFWYLPEALEPVFAPDDSDDITGFECEITREDSVIFPELTEFIGKKVFLWENAQGFVFGKIDGLTPAQVERAAGHIWLK